jgi:hypothetical protein
MERPAALQSYEFLLININLANFAGNGSRRRAKGAGRKVEGIRFK